MKLALTLIHGAIVVLLVLTVLLYPSAATWATFSIGFSLWFGALSFVLATRKLQIAAQIAGYYIHGLAMFMSLGILAGYAFGQKWCLILAVAVAFFSGIVTVVIARFYPPEAAETNEGVEKAS